jgi:hypothetical protein
MSKAENKSTATVLTAEELQKIATRLVEHAGNIHNHAWRHAVADIMLASRALDQMARLQTGLLDIAGKTLDSTTAAQIRALITDTENV